MIPFDYNRAEKIAKRTKAFYEGGNGKVQIHIKSCQEWKLPELPPLSSFNFPEDMEIYLDMVAEKDYQYARFHETIEDDFIPSSTPFYGIAEHTAFLGGEVTFSDITSFQHQICEQLEDFRKLKLERENTWLRLVVDGMAYMREKWGEYIPIRLRGADGPSDIANAIRGNDFFYDIYDDPEVVDELLQFCVKAANFTFELQRSEATKVGDGCINGFGIWMPGKCAGHISEDFSTMISKEIYEEIFFSSLKKFSENYDTVMLHTHSLGHRMIPLFAEIEKIKIIEISSDPNAERAVDVFRKYHDQLSEKVVVVKPTYEELLEMTDVLECSKTLICYDAKDEEDAKRVLAAVEKFRA